MKDIIPNIDKYKSKGFNIDFSTNSTNLSMKIEKSGLWTETEFDNIGISHIRKVLNSEGVNIINREIEKSIQYIEEATV